VARPPWFWCMLMKPSKAYWMQDNSDYERLEWFEVHNNALRTKKDARRQGRESNENAQGCLGIRHTSRPRRACLVESGGVGQP
jgi:hypothetical protein